MSEEKHKLDPATVQACMDCLPNMGDELSQSVVELCRQHIAALLPRKPAPVLRRNIKL